MGDARSARRPARLARRVAAMGMLLAALIVGAAGLSGFLVDDDHCITQPIGWVEGTHSSGDTRLWPPGYECVYWSPIATSADGRFSYSEGPTARVAEGSVAGFLVALAVGLVIAGLALVKRPRVPRPLRWAAVTVAAFAAFGAGAVLVGGFLAGIFIGFVVGVPLAFLVDRRLRPEGRGTRRLTTGAGGAAVAFVAVFAAGFLLFVGPELSAFGIVLLAVALLGAVPWPTGTSERSVRVKGA